ncbi:Efflux ABC transporter, ATP-binding protein [Streptomyces misionensis JCM 4497]
MAQRADLPAHRHRPRAGGDVRLPHRTRVRRRQRRDARPRRQGRPAGAGHGRDGVRPGPQDRHLLQGHAPAREDGERPGARPVAAAAGRAVQRHGPAPAHAADGPAAQDGRRGPHRAVLLAHPRRGRAARPAHRGRRRRAARGQRRLPQDPPADDRPAAPLPGALQRRPRPRGRADRRPVHLRHRGRPRRGRAAHPGRRLRPLHHPAAEGRQGPRHPAAHGLAVGRVPGVRLLVPGRGVGGRRCTTPPSPGSPTGPCSAVAGPSSSARCRCCSS